MMNPYVYLKCTSKILKKKKEKIQTTPPPPQMNKRLQSLRENKTSWKWWDPANSRKPRNLYPLWPKVERSCIVCALGSVYLKLLCELKERKHREKADHLGLHSSCPGGWDEMQVHLPRCSSWLPGAPQGVTTFTHNVTPEQESAICSAICTGAGGKTGCAGFTQR